MNERQTFLKFTFFFFSPTDCITNKFICTTSKFNDEAQQFKSEIHLPLYGGFHKFKKTQDFKKKTSTQDVFLKADTRFIQPAFCLTD